jgi:hypothetical protein
MILLRHSVYTYLHIGLLWWIKKIGHEHYLVHDVKWFLLLLFLFSHKLGTGWEWAIKGNVIVEWKE